MGDNRSTPAIDVIEERDLALAVIAVAWGMIPGGVTGPAALRSPACTVAVRELAALVDGAFAALDIEDRAYDDVFLARKTEEIFDVFAARPTTVRMTKGPFAGTTWALTPVRPGYSSREPVEGGDDTTRIHDAVALLECEGTGRRVVLWFRGDDAVESWTRIGLAL
jgi:hypothetical protein